MAAPKLARILAISVVLTALTQGGVAHAQESDTGLGGTATTAAPAASTRPGCCCWPSTASPSPAPPRRPGRPGRPGLSIPGIGVRAPIVGVGRKANGAMQTPDPGQVGWYRNGPKPGDPGPGVLVGHVDTRTGPDVFHRLGRLRPGDEILVGRPDGTTARFLVGHLERHPKTALPTSRIWTKANQPLLRLITCAGSFDHATGYYRDNLILYASPTGS